MGPNTKTGSAARMSDIQLVTLSDVVCLFKFPSTLIGQILFTWHNSRKETIQSASMIKTRKEGEAGEQ